MTPCTWRRRVPLATLYCRGKAEGHEGAHQEEALSPSNAHADVLRDRMEYLARAGVGAAQTALADAEAAAEAVRSGSNGCPHKADRS